MISGMIGTESSANESPVSIIPKHINSTVCGRSKITDGPKKKRARDVVKRADKVM